MSRRRHANLVFLHARRQSFPAWQELKEALHVVWPVGEAACVQEVIERLGERWSPAEREAAVWKVVADSAAQGHLLVDLASVSLSGLTPLICLASDAPSILPDPLPSELSESVTVLPEEALEEGDKPVNLSSTFDDSTLEAPLRERTSRATSEPSKPCWLGQPSSMRPENTRSRARPSHAWCSERAHVACSPVCLMGPTAENGTCIPLFKKSFGGSSCCLPSCR